METYGLKGVVVRLDAEAKTATVKHETIANAAGKVWMEPMTMEFPVPKPADWAKLEPGRPIRADVLTRDSGLEYWLENVRSQTR